MIPAFFWLKGAGPEAAPPGGETAPQRVEEGAFPELLQAALSQEPAAEVDPEQAGSSWTPEWPANGPKNSDLPVSPPLPVPTRETDSVGEQPAPWPRRVGREGTTGLPARPGEGLNSEPEAGTAPTPSAAPEPKLMKECGAPTNFAPDLGPNPSPPPSHGCAWPAHSWQPRIAPGSAEHDGTLQRNGNAGVGEPPASPSVRGDQAGLPGPANAIPAAAHPALPHRTTALTEPRLPAARPMNPETNAPATVSCNEPGPVRFAAAPVAHSIPPLALADHSLTKSDPLKAKEEPNPALALEAPRREAPAPEPPAWVWRSPTSAEQPEMMGQGHAESTTTAATEEPRPAPRFPAAIQTSETTSQWAPGQPQPSAASELPSPSGPSPRPAAPQPTAERPEADPFRETSRSLSGRDEASPKSDLPEPGPKLRLQPLATERETGRRTSVEQMSPGALPLQPAEGPVVAGEPAGQTKANSVSSNFAPTTPPALGRSEPQEVRPRREVGWVPERPVAEGKAFSEETGRAPAIERSAPANTAVIGRPRAAFDPPGSRREAGLVTESKPLGPALEMEPETAWTGPGGRMVVEGMGPASELSPSALPLHRGKSPVVAYEPEAQTEANPGAFNLAPNTTRAVGRSELQGEGLRRDVGWGPERPGFEVKGPAREVGRTLEMQRLAATNPSANWRPRETAEPLGARPATTANPVLEFRLSALSQAEGSPVTSAPPLDAVARESLEKGPAQRAEDAGPKTHAPFETLLRAPPTPGPGKEAAVPPLIQQRPDGIAGAKQHVPMQTEAKPAEIAAPEEQKLPGGGVNLPGRKPVAGAIPANGLTIVGDVGPTPEGWPKEMAPEPTGGRMPAGFHAARLHPLITEAALRLQDSGRDSVTVTLRPDPGTELNLEIRVVEGRLEARMEVQTGDAAGLESNWRELQQRLEDHGIRLADPGTALGGTSGDGRQKQAPAPWRMVEPDLAFAPRPSEKAPGHPAAVSVGGSDQRVEFWA